MFPFIECQCFVKRRGVYLVEKVSVFIKVRVLFWPEISALGVFFNFDNERMRPLNTQVQLQKKTLELVVKRRKFLPSYGFLSHCDMN